MVTTMKTKTRTQVTDLSTAESYLTMARRCLELASEPALAMAVSASLSRVTQAINSIRSNPAAVQEKS